MGTQPGPLVVRRSIWIDAKPERVWEEFESFESMKAWFGTGHTLVSYEPRVGGWVETDPSNVQSEDLRFEGRVTVFDPPNELTFEQDWVGRGWPAPALITFRLTPTLNGTLVELLHHGFEQHGADAAENHRGFEDGWKMLQLEALRGRVETKDPFAAIADPTRRAILDLLRTETSLTAGSIAAEFPNISRPAVSKHLGVLRDAALVRARADGREWHYSLDPGPLATVYEGWLRKFVPLWDESLRQLKANVENAPKGARRRRDVHPRTR